MKMPYLDGQRVRVTRDLHHPSDILEGETGIVTRTPYGFGFLPDKSLHGTVALRRKVNGQYKPVLDYCEPINSQLAETQELPDFEEGEGLL